MRGAKGDLKNYYWLLVTLDQYELPIIVAEEIEELAQICNVLPRSIVEQISRAKKTGFRCKWKKSAKRRIYEFGGSRRMTGTCKFCGQTMMVEAGTIEQANEMATMDCKCDEGRAYRNIEDMKREAKANAEALFGIEEVPFPDENEQMKNAALLDMMDVIINNVAAGIIKKCSLTLNERTTATIFITPKDGIKIKKNYKEEFTLEANRY